jgi:hypothetical protein
MNTLEEIFNNYETAPEYCAGPISGVHHRGYLEILRYIQLRFKMTRRVRKYSSKLVPTSELSLKTL